MAYIVMAYIVVALKWPTGALGLVRRVDAAAVAGRGVAGDVAVAGDEAEVVTPERGSIFSNIFGARRGLDRIGGWQRKGLGETPS